jgi:hypothetical protein
MKEQGCPSPNSSVLAMKRERERQLRVQSLERMRPVLPPRKGGSLHVITDRWGRVHVTRAKCAKDAIHNAVNRIGCTREDIDPVTGVVKVFELSDNV